MGLNRFGSGVRGVFATGVTMAWRQSLTFRTAPEGPNYHLEAAKVGFRAEKRDNGGLRFHEAPVKFP